MEVSPKLKRKLKNIPASPGVYLYFNKDKKVIYVGKAKNLRNRVSSYFVNTPKGAKTRKMLSLVADLNIIQVRSEVEAFLLEAELIKRYKPRYNILMKDDKSYKYIAVQDFDVIWEGKKYIFSRILSVHGTSAKRTRYYGPYPDGGLVIKVLRHLRKIFPHCNYTKNKIMKSLREERKCLYAEIGLCTGVCADISNFEKNRKNILAFERFLKKGYATAVEDIDQRMKKLSREMKYEEAKELRDVLLRLNKLETASILPDQYRSNPNLMVDIYKGRVSDIETFLEIANINRIECYDISNLAEKWTVGSMVVSESGQLKKSEYRKFRIKYTKGISDFGMMKEVLERRIKNNWPLPDILLLDGGKGQIISVIKAVRNTPFETVPIIGIFKPNDYFIRKVNDKWKITKVERQNIGFLHLRELRDEAHRFANQYRKKLIEKEQFDYIRKKVVRKP